MLWGESNFVLDKTGTSNHFHRHDIFCDFHLFDEWDRLKRVVIFAMDLETGWFRHFKESKMQKRDQKREGCLFTLSTKQSNVRGRVLILRQQFPIFRHLSHFRHRFRLLKFSPALLYSFVFSQSSVYAFVSKIEYLSNGI